MFFVLPFFVFFVDFFIEIGTLGSSEVKLSSDSSSLLLADVSMTFAALIFLDFFRFSSFSVSEFKSDSSSASFNFFLATA